MTLINLVCRSKRQKRRQREAINAGIYLAGEDDSLKSIQDWMGTAGDGRPPLLIAVKAKL